MGLKTILVSGAEVRDRFNGNRGAEQLLRTTCARLRGMGIQPAVTIGQVDPSLVHELGLREYLGNPRLGSLQKMLPRIDTKRFVSVNGLSGVLDVSGFALGDAWGHSTATWILRKYKQWAASGLPIVALPQAYGPFSDPRLAATVAEAISLCEVAFPRDTTSRNYLLALGFPEKVGEMVPDITIAHRSDEPRLRQNRLVLVPNWNMVKRGNEQSYLRLLDETVVAARDRELEVVGLLHEGAKDLEVLYSLKNREAIQIDASLTGWETKQFIASSRAVVSGRYHAVIAALSTETPVLAHSWSHKYQEALEGFGVADWTIKPTEVAEVAKKLDGILDADRSSALVDGRAKATLAIEQMWRDVDAIFSRAPRSDRGTQL